jgi:hypothetical protein
MRLMRQRLSPRDMILLEIACPAADEDAPASEDELAGLACTGCRLALSCGLPVRASRDGFD